MKPFNKIKHIVVTGVGRSGTTILGKLIHSFNGVEHVNEPYMVQALLLLLNEIKQEYWMNLYESYLYEEVFINSLAGRFINTNQYDDSSIYKVKPQREIIQRLNTINSRDKIEKEIDSSSAVSYKIAGMINFLPKLMKYYPDAYYVVIVRNWRSVFKSILKKGWFKDEILKSKAGMLSWPNRVFNNFRIPFWVPVRYEEFFVKQEEIERIAMYYLHLNENLIQILDKCIVVDYDDLVEGPVVFSENLATLLGCRYGDCSEEIENSIERKINNPYNGKGLDPYFISRLDTCYEILKKKSQI